MSHSATSFNGHLPLTNTGWRLFCRLVTGSCQPSPLWSLAYRCKFLLRTLIWPVSTLRWLNTVSHLPFHTSLLSLQPTLPCRLHRPYLLAKLHRKQVLDMLTFHYQQLYQQLPAPLLTQIMQSAGVVLAHLDGKDHIDYHIKLALQGDLDKEGEMSLLFTDAQGITLARLTFVLFCYQAERALFIGGLQGAHPSVAHDQIQKATKACHGLFPKRLLAEALMVLAKQLAVVHLFAVNNSAHIYAHWRYQKKGQKMYADYDGFWQSLGGTVSPQGYYQLPQTIARKSMEQIPSKKRAEYSRRYQLLDSLNQQVKALFINA